MLSKTTLDHGWWWSNPMLSAPATFDALAFPANANVDQFFVWMLRWFSRDAGLCTNLAWMAMVALSGVVATLCLRQLRVSRVVSFAVGVLYALSPYAFYRNINHFVLVTYLVPIACSVAVLIATGEIAFSSRKARLALMAGSALLGFNYIYYAFFACFFFISAAGIGFLNSRDRKIPRMAAVFLLIAGGATVLNLAPSFFSWAKHGKPVAVRDKLPAEADVYGLKIRQLVSPVFAHTFPPFRHWTDLDTAARFPLETENRGSRLGLVATLGFLALLFAVFVPQMAGWMPCGPVFLGAGRLSLAAVLLATIGGFGSLFNLFVSPEIRMYNRISPFISFFSLLGIALIADALLEKAPLAGRRIWAPVAAAGLLLAGVYDQGHAAIPLNQAYADIQPRFEALRSLVSSMERRLPERAMVFQLPLTTYLNDSGNLRMQPYDHLGPYLVSHRLHWSYPALSNERVHWQQAVSRLPAREMAHALRGAGFSALLLDRYGYEDSGNALLSEITGAMNPGSVLAENSRYVALDLGALRPVAPDRLSQLTVSSGPATARLPACEGAPLYSIDQVGLTRAPFSQSVHVAGRGEITVQGWAVDAAAKTAAGDVDVVIDRRLFAAFYGRDRGDVAGYYKIPAYRNTGFTAKIPAAQLAKGSHSLSLRVVSADRRCFRETPPISFVID